MSDIEIARNTQLNKITDITDELGIPEEYVEQYGKYKAKISNDYYKEIKDRKNGKLILVTAINPTPLGEGKTTTSRARCSRATRRETSTSRCTWSMRRAPSR